MNRRCGLFGPGPGDGPQHLLLEGLGHVLAGSLHPGADARDGRMGQRAVGAGLGLRQPGDVGGRARRRCRTQASLIQEPQWKRPIYERTERFWGSHGPQVGREITSANGWTGRRSRP